MEKTASMNLGDYFFELGNRFFNVEQNQWEVLNNDLDYEEEEREGFNGIILKLEQQSDEFRSFLSRILLWIKNWFIGTGEEIKGPGEHKSKSGSSTFPANADAQRIINMRVRKRLLESLNEDAHLWLESPYQKRNIASRDRKSPYHRNCFKSEKVQLTTGSNTVMFKRLKHFIKHLRKIRIPYNHSDRAGASKNVLIS